MFRPRLGAIDLSQAFDLMDHHVVGIDVALIVVTKGNVNVLAFVFAIQREPPL